MCIRDRVDVVALGGGDAPGTWLDRPAARAVNRIAVLIHPGADLAQSGGELLLDRAVRLGADVQQEVPVVPSRAGQILDQLLGGLEPLVRLVVTPGAVNGVA